jgi:hypothetical protein
MRTATALLAALLTLSACSTTGWKHASHTSPDKLAADEASCRESSKDASSKTLRVVGLGAVMVVDVALAMVTFGTTAGSLVGAYADGLPREVTYEKCMSMLGYKAL